LISWRQATKCARLKQLKSGQKYRASAIQTVVTQNFHAVLFDLDGTLANTLADLANATNWALTQLGCPTHPVDRYRFMVGDGVRQLCLRALPADRQDLVERAVQLERDRYREHCYELTQLYPGIPDLISELAKRGLQLAVLSNKPDDFTREMIQHYFCSRESHSWQSREPRQGIAATIGPFNFVRGQLPDVPLKPDPTAALQIAQELGIAPAQWLYLGDTNTDMRTARAAGMTAVGVLWGFRDREELIASGAHHLVARPDAILKLL
jgi:phosphoglycolate phosphatase